MSGFVCYAKTDVNAVPYDTYAYVETADENQPLCLKTMFQVSSVLDGKTLGFSGFEGIKDIFIAENNNVYVLDGANNNIVILNSDLTLKRILSNYHTAEDGPLTLNQPQGIFVDKDYTIWVADTENKRVLHIDDEGNALSIMQAPKGDLIPKDLKFFPMKVAKDHKGYLYILCRGSYYGAMVYDENCQFLSFYGANKVKTGLLGGLQRIFQRMFTSNEKLAVSAQKLPFQFLDFEINQEDFIYTVSSSKTGQVRRLGPGGENSLYRSSSSSESYNFGDIETYIDDSGIEKSQKFNSITTDEDGNIYLLDNNYGRIYLYNAVCQNICVFGGGIGNGRQEGTFISPNSLTYYKSGLLVADEQKGSITYFEPTEYGKQVLKANRSTQEGDYETAIALWQEVLSQNSMYQIAHRSLAKCYYSTGKYSKAMNYAKRGMDQEMYAKAFTEVKETFISEHFFWLFMGAVFLISGLLVLIIVSIRKKVVLVHNEKWRLALRVPIHPFESFTSIKYKHKGSVLIAAILTFVFYLVTILGKEYGGFMYNLPGKSGIDSFYTFLGTAGIVVLFSGINWAIAALFDGKGKSHEIFIATAYSLLPLIAYRFIYIVASHIAVPGNGGLLMYLSAISLIATVFCLLIGQIIVNDYSLWKTLAVGIMTILGMVVIAILCFAVVILLQNIVGFVLSIYNEAFLR